MASYLDLQNAIANDLTRSDLTSQIQSAIQDAIVQYETDRFWFNTTRSLTFNTVSGQSAYTGSDLAQLANVVQIDKLYIKNGISTYPITYEEPDQFEYLTSLVNTSGLPFCWTYVDNQLSLYPTPLQVYVMRPHMHYRLTPLVNPADTNAWCNEGQKLIKAHAKLILYADLLEDNDGVQRMQLQIPAIKMKLDSETSKKGSSGKIRSTNF